MSADRRPAAAGIRELKAHASALVRRAAAGEVVEITDRGRPVARLVPIGDEIRWWEGMIERGELVPPGRDLSEVFGDGPPAPPLPGERSAFEALMELRADER